MLPNSCGITGLDIQEVIPFSTGVIGEKLPVKKITAGVPEP